MDVGLVNDIHWYLLWMSVRVSGDQAFMYLWALFKGRLWNRLQKRIARWKFIKHLRSCWVAKLTFLWPFFFFFFHALVCSFFQGYLHNLRSVVCSAQNISQLVEKKKDKMGKNKYDNIFLQSNVFNVWRKKQMRCLITLMKNDFQYELRNN